MIIFLRSNIINSTNLTDLSDLTIDFRGNLDYSKGLVQISHVFDSNMK